MISEGEDTHGPDVEDDGAARQRPLHDWLAPDFELIAEPDEKDAWTVVFADVYRTLVASASPSGLMSLATEHPMMFKSDRHQSDHWLHKGCPVQYGLINAAVKCRTDPPSAATSEYSELREGVQPIGLEEACLHVVPLIERMAVVAHLEGVGSSSSIRRRLRQLEAHALTSLNFSDERMYYALGAVRFALTQAEEHPRYVSYRAAFEFGRAMILSRQADSWHDVVILAENLV